MVTITRAAVTTSQQEHSEFDTLVAQTYRRAYNLAYKLAGNRDDAEDLTQEAYLRAFRSFPTYDRSLPFANWLLRILFNRFVDLRRQRLRRATLSLDAALAGVEGDTDVFLEIPDQSNDPAHMVASRSLDERIEAALASIPPRFCIAVLLCDVEQMSYAEVAQVLQIPIGTVRSRIHRGRQLLRKWIQNWHE